jgi:Undecaprenyl-phosphate glucose phosphotransferase
MNEHLGPAHLVSATPAGAKPRVAISSNVMSGVSAILDSLAIAISGIFLYFGLVDPSGTHLDYYFSAICFVWIVALLLFQFAGLYQFEAIVRPFQFADKLLISFLTVFLFLLALGFAFKISANFSRAWIASFAIGSCISTFSARLVLAAVALHLSNQHIFQRNVIVAGTGEQCRRLLRLIEQAPHHFTSIVGLFAPAAAAGDSEVRGAPVLGEIADIGQFIRTNSVDDVIIAFPWAAEEETVALLERLRELPVNVYLASDLIGLRLDLRPPPSHFESIPVFEVIGRPMSGWGTAVKRLEDLVIGSLATAVFLPLMAFIAILIKIDSPGSVIFRQTRLGFNNRPFEIYKFRTMVTGSDRSEKTVQAKRDDPRVTRVGRLLRRTSLDELPQLFNVLAGSMSLVGPRPHAVDHNEDYARKIRWYFARHRVKPGMTGWAQVHGLRGETETTEKMETRVKYDIYYTENWSLMFDLRILARTAFILIGGRNAY